MTETNNTEAAEQAWDEARYEAALAHLETLQEQLDSLRGALSSIVAPLGKSNLSKPQLFMEIKQAAVTSTTDVQAFRDNWKSEQTQALIAKVKDSMQRDDNLNKADDVPRYGWRNQR